VEAFSFWRMLLSCLARPRMGTSNFKAQMSNGRWGHEDLYGRFLPGSERDRGSKKARARITLIQVLQGDTLGRMEEQVANMAIASSCEVLVPQHHDPLFRVSVKTDLSELKRILAARSEMVFQEFVPDRWYTFDESQAV